MATNVPDISIVIPALNERENLELLLPLLSEVVSTLNLKSEIIIADGGSADGTAEFAEQQGAQVVLQSERGYGGALLAGFARARAAYVVTMDADLSHPPVFLRDFWQQRATAEMLIASRYIAGGKADMGPSRRVLSAVLNKTYARVLDLPLADLSSGFRLYHRDILEKLELQSRDFDVLEEILVKVHLLGARIKEVPFHYQARNSGKSHAKLLKFGWAFVRTLVRMRRLRNTARVLKK
ncbi:MAG: glycosyltransferase [Pyrinomonadaceae bacterium]